jgi:manganese/zinc/iron transport system permease protein
MAVAAGVEFGAVFLLAPDRGVAAAIARRARQRREFAADLLAIHLLHHEGGAAVADENHLDHLHEHLRWAPAFARRVVGRAERRGLLRREPDGRLYLTGEGRESARRAMVP